MKADVNILWGCWEGGGGVQAASGLSGHNSAACCAAQQPFNGEQNLIVGKLVEELQAEKKLSVKHPDLSPTKIIKT